MVINLITSLGSPRIESLLIKSSKVFTQRLNNSWLVETTLYDDENFVCNWNGIDSQLLSNLIVRTVVQKRCDGSDGKAEE